MHGFLVAGNMNIECLGQYADMGQCRQYNRLLNKFPKDQVFLDEGGQISFLDGYVHNKEHFCIDGDKEWQHAFAQAMKEDAVKCLRTLRGGFCGYVYDRQEFALTAFTDQVSVKALYYYVNGSQWMVSNHIPYMTAVLKANGVPYHFNETAAKYMLTYGYMLDGSTFVEEIHRLLPGQLVHIGNGRAEVERYYLIPNKEVQMSEQEAVGRIDSAFREAVRREFDKDREYGYRHLVDLSGGLDSRMVSWVAHDMGYTDQLNVTYCRADYLDYKISSQIAVHLGHEYFFKALDDANWLYDIDEIVSQNNGAALYTGITGGSRLLGTLNTDRFGLEHTGMIGDITLSTFYHDRELNFGKPRLGLNQYSNRFSYAIDSQIMEEYPCQEMFAIYTRGMMGAMSSYIIRQHYVETSSPFTDVDFLEVNYSIPFEYRDKHYIYLKWMAQKYPQSTSFGWEKWGGIKPRKDHILFRKVKTTQRLLWQAARKAFRLPDSDSMNPLDFWYQERPGIQEHYRKYYDSNRGRIGGELGKDISLMFEEGNVTEKSMALTVLGAVKLYF
ncbi:MAG: hypothetical protein K2K90_18445 [Lachnospiraceae bacterium]|nr:hypothetical protein [Lachnospiraceae bacterium]